MIYSYDVTYDVTSYHIKSCKVLLLLYFILKLLMWTTSALRDYEYSVC